MSKSYRKTPIIGNCSGSDKPYKKLLHKKERRTTRMKIKSGEFDLLNKSLFFYDDWTAPKDGKQWLDEKTPKFFTPNEWKRYRRKLMRK